MTLNCEKSKYFICYLFKQKKDSIMNIKKIVIISGIGLLIVGCMVKLPVSQEAHFSVPKKSSGSDCSFSSSFAPPPVLNTESYNHQKENIFYKVTAKPLSTLSTDVDTASYTNIRRFINNDLFPPEGAVRIEEMLNYFSYNYNRPTKSPFLINSKVGKSLWNEKNLILQIGLATKKVDIDSLPPSNLVFLIDVSGSMQSRNKLPLLKKSLKLLVKNLRKMDKVSLVVYAGAAGVVLENAGGDEKSDIMTTINRLEAGGSTAGGAGIKLAYKIAKKSFIKDGNNRIILASDGDFNVGQSSESELIDLVEKNRKSGIYLTILGFGMGNYKDDKMEALADKGNGNYAYIDNLLEAKKVLVTQMSGTLHTVAKDVKVQIEFNPNYIDSYRLIGYENRVMNAEDFNDDKKDAAEIGMGHQVTALYELITKKNAKKSKIDDLKYQKQALKERAKSDELATIKIRYKNPNSEKSLLITKVIGKKSDNIDKNDFNFAMSVAGFGMLLTNSKYKNSLDYSKIIKVAKDSKGDDENGHRSEFIRLVEKAELLKK